MGSCQEEKDKCYFVYGYYESDTLDVLNNKRSNIKSWEVKYDL